MIGKIIPLDAENGGCPGPRMMMSPGDTSLYVSIGNSKSRGYDIDIADLVKYLADNGVDFSKYTDSNDAPEWWGSAVIYAQNIEDDSVFYLIYSSEADEYYDYCGAAYAPESFGKFIRMIEVIVPKKNTEN